MNHNKIGQLNKNEATSSDILIKVFDKAPSKTVLISTVYQ